MAKVFFLRALNSPFGFQLVSLSFVLCFFLAFRPSYNLSQPFVGEMVRFGGGSDFVVLEPGFIENSLGKNTSGLGEILIEDGDGERVVQKKRYRQLSYNVKHGDSVSRIAHKFGLRVSTVLWANEITAKTKLTPGDKLIIPPTDGVYYEVKSYETLGEIAKAHGINLKKIYAYNNIKNDVIKSGQMLFIPEAQKTFIAQKPAPRYNTSTYRRPGSSTSTVGQIKSLNYRMRRPTLGTLTQGYHSKHYGIDIANKLNTPIYAAAPGKVKLVRNGGWNYGYGTYVIIDHGDGVETLYAHNNVNKVEVGQTVKAGQLISLMGNTGNVFGPTGIHLHFELRINGRKVNPNHYFN